MENLKWEVDQKEREIQSLKQQLDLTEQQSRKELDGTQQLLQVSGLRGLSGKVGGSPQAGAERAGGCRCAGAARSQQATWPRHPVSGGRGRRSPEPRAMPGLSCVRLASCGSQDIQ